MSKCSCFILLIAIIFGSVPFLKNFDTIKNLLGLDKIKEVEDKTYLILSKKNATLEKEFEEKYLKLKEEIIKLQNNNTYLKYERKMIEKLKQLDKDKTSFENYENEINNRKRTDLNASELKQLTELIDRYILSEND